MVISGGVNVYPAEIESVIHQIPQVDDAAVSGIPDEEFGESLVIHIQLPPGAQLTEEEIRAHLAARLAKYKVPRRIVFDEQLPREDSGKLFKRRIKQMYLEKV